MTKLNQIYKCEECGNIVEVVHGGGPTPVCCGQPMTMLEANTVDAAVEKHVPVIEKIDGGFKVSVGSVPHPMLEEHYIEWIEIMTETEIYRKYLKPGDNPVAEFKLEAQTAAARTYCNLHGLWKSE